MSSPVMSRILTVKDVPLERKRVLMRVDFNVPLDAGRVADDTRIRETLPTLEYLYRHHASVVLCSHLGRPKGKPDLRYSLQPVAERLRILLDERLGRGVQVGFCPETVGMQAREMAGALAPGGFLVLENLRFQPQEEANDQAFARQLAELGEIYVTDAFGSAHRAHASTDSVARFLKPAIAGLLMARELEYLGRALQSPDHPFVVVFGGAKIADKIPILEKLAAKADTFLIGGGMAYTFLAAQGQGIGASLFEADQVNTARRLLDRAAAGDFRLLLPIDHVIADKLEANVPARVVEDIPAGAKAFDIGPRTLQLFRDELRRARMVLWNGPMGVFETPPFNRGTNEMARILADSPAVTIVGGGDSAAAVNAAGLASRMAHVSTGGGAALEFLSGLTLPGVAVLSTAA